jgi:hypothetical protein
MAIAKAQPAKKAYNPYAYAPGGSSTAVSKAIQTAGYAKPAPAPVVKAPTINPIAPPNSLNSIGSDAAQEYGGGGGYSYPQVVWNPGPNYGADLVGAPDFTEANANYTQAVNLAHQQRQQRVRAALIKLGFQPGSADAAALEGIDPSTADLAQNNSASALAKLGLKRGTDRADLSAELAARGILDSGALRGGENMVQSSYDQGLLGATSDYLNEQNTALGDEANTLATGQSTFTAAKAAAALSAAQNPLFTPTYYGAAAPGDTLAPDQGQRPDQTPVLAKPPVIPRQVPAPPERYYTYKNQVKLGPGETLKFAAGKGYYAG